MRLEGAPLPLPPRCRSSKQTSTLFFTHKHPVQEGKETTSERKQNDPLLLPEQSSQPTRTQPRRAGRGPSAVAPPPCVAWPPVKERPEHKGGREAPQNVRAFPCGCPLLQLAPLAPLRHTPPPPAADLSPPLESQTFFFTGEARGVPSCFQDFPQGHDLGGTDVAIPDPSKRGKAAWPFQRESTNKTPLMLIC